MGSRANRDELNTDRKVYRQILVICRLYILVKGSRKNGVEIGELSGVESLFLERRNNLS